MLCQETGGEHPAFHVPDDAIYLARQIHQFTGIIQSNKVAGNGSIIITLKIAGGKLRRFLDFSFLDTKGEMGPKEKKNKSVD